jgi:drug/metabolite transporter (DMT)-like permease
MLFGANTVAIKISLTGVGVLTTGGIRFTGGAIAIFCWAVCTGKPLAVNRRQLRQLAPLPFILFTQLSLFYYGQSKTYASHGALLANLLPFVVMILAHFFVEGDRISIKKILGLLFGFSAVVLLFTSASPTQEGAILGDFLILGAVLIWGAHVIYIKTIIHNFHPVQITLYPMILAGPMFLVSAMIFDPQMIISLNPSVISALFYQTFVTASFGFVAWNTLIQRYGATSLHSFVFIMPISGVFLGVVMLGEPLTSSIIGSIVLVVLGLMIVNKPDEKNGETT